MNTVQLMSSSKSVRRINPVHEQFDVAVNSVGVLLLFFKAVLAEDWKKADRREKEIRLIEKKSQKIKQNLRLGLSKYLTLGQHNNDLIDLLGLQNQIAVKSCGIVSLIYNRKLVFPESVRNKVLDLVTSTTKITETSRDVIEDFEICRLSHSASRSPQIIERLVRDHSRLDVDANRLTQAIRSRLFKTSLNLEPADLLILLQVIDLISDLADSSQLIGARLQVFLCNS